MQGLTQSQKDKQHDLINQAQTKQQVDDIVNNSKQLDNSMNQLQQIVNNDNTVKQNSDFINEDSSQQDAYIIMQFKQQRFDNCSSYYHG